YSCSCGGVAYLGVFDDTSNYYKPALVFYDKLGPGNEKYIAEAISHEAGHNMGLSHDGNATTGYYSGQGSGATGWAPIMGVGYYQSLVQWSRGEYSGANNTQDDYAVMQSNGLLLRTDDHGGTRATATALTATSSGGLTSLAAVGIIERPGDVDMFSFAAGAGSASFTVSPAARSANLDALVTLSDSNGAVLATFNPADALNATFSATLPAAGTYYLAVTGTGKGDPLTTGYSNYGSLGQYAVAATVYTPGSVAPTAVIVASATSGTAPVTVNFSGTGSTDPDGSVVAWDWSFSDGVTASGSTTSRTWSTAGSYVATLKVTDNAGLSASSSVTVTVNAPVVIVPLHVAAIDMSRTVTRNGVAQAQAGVKVVDGNGLPMAGASVSGRWSGLVSGTGTLTTGTDGYARFSSPTTRATTGTFTFTVTGITRSNATYASTGNVETSDSIAR
ncbi:MAG TPA: PKD domain-containing protein, partial [Aquabacterium sp.]|nr:PKD domain-containing protein [Aquabacterium sp.]